MWNTPGKVTQRGPNSFEVEIIWVNGRRIRRRYKNRKSADRMLGWIRAAQRPKDEIDSATTTSCWEHYLARLRKESKRSTVETVERIRKHWASLEGIKFSALKQQQIDKLVDSWSVSTSTVNLRIKVLRAALNRDARDNLIDKTPVQLRERKRIYKLPHVLLRSEIRRLLSRAPDPLQMYGRCTVFRWSAPQRSDFPDFG